MKKLDFFICFEYYYIISIYVRKVCTMRKNIINFIISLAILLSGIFIYPNIITPTTASAEIATDISNLNPVEQTYNFLKTYEGCDTNCFWDNAQWTIGIGNRCPYPHSRKGNYWHEPGGHSISESDAKDLFFKELPGYVTRLKSNCKGLSVTQNQFDVLLSGTYNHGNVLPNGCSSC